MTVSVGDPDSLLHDLTAEQRDAVTTAASPLCIIAGAGSGKTRVLTRRIAWQSATGAIDPRRVLALTFTRRAASEMRSRLDALGLRDHLSAGTFHGIALAQLRNRWDEHGQRHHQLLERPGALVAQTMGKAKRHLVAESIAEISWARARLITPDQYPERARAAGRRTQQRAETIATTYSDYEQAKRKRRVIDFDDVLALCHATLRQDPKFAAAQRWRNRHLLVDEFQDVNPLQFELLKAWMAPVDTTAETDLVIVGDPDQAIYGWNGADPELINTIGQHLVGTAVVHLRTNFRSSPEILAAGGAVLGRDPQPATKPSGPQPTVTALATDAAEVDHVARAVRDSHPPGSLWSDQAILARTNAQLPAMKAALDRVGIPVRSRGDLNPLNQPAIADLIAPWAPAARLDTVLKDAYLELDRRHLDPSDYDLTQSVLTLGREHLQIEPESTVADFLTLLRTDDRPAYLRDAVELTTFHAAKGLEFPVVHLIGIENGYVPIAAARNRAAVAEERRLLHVAVTRAERQLHITWAQTRSWGDELRSREPSPWLEAIADAAVTDDEPVDRVAVHATRALLKPSRDQAPAPALSEELRQALDGWRMNAGHGAQVDPRAVLSDLSLDAIVVQRPRRLDDLLTIPGLGPSTRRRFGPTIIELVNKVRP